MTFLWLNLTIVFLFSYFSRYFATHESISEAILPIRPNKLLVVGALLSLILISQRVSFLEKLLEHLDPTENIRLNMKPFMMIFIV